MPASFRLKSQHFLPRTAQNTWSRLKNICTQSLRSLGLNEQRCFLCSEPCLPQKFTSSLANYSIVLCAKCRLLLKSYHKPDYSVSTSFGLHATSHPANTASNFKNTSVCSRCFLAAPSNEYGEVLEFSSGLCPYCAYSSPNWHEAFCFGAYDGELRQLLLQAKFRNNIRALTLAGLLLTEAVLMKNNFNAAQKNLKWDFITAVPLHPKRLRHRGFNQALEIAKVLGKIIKVPVQHSALKRVVYTTPQAGLSQRQRRLNLKGSIQVGSLNLNKRSKKTGNFFGEFEGLTILLVDDILTTGTTLTQSAEALLKAGAKQVDVAVIARTNLFCDYKSY